MGAERIRAASADVHPSVGGGGNGELDRVTSLVAAVGRPRTVPRVGGQVAGIVGMYHLWAETMNQECRICWAKSPAGGGVVAPVENF